MEQFRKEQREYFLNKFNGSAFVGTIIKRQRVQVDWIAYDNNGRPVTTEYYRYTVRISDYWFGVDSKIVFVYGPPEEVTEGRYKHHDSCGFTLNKGQIYFFTPRFVKNNLDINMCDYARGGSDPGGYRGAEFRKIMGEPKRFY